MVAKITGCNLYRVYRAHIPYGAKGFLRRTVTDSLSTMLQLLGEESEEASWLI